MFLALPYYSHSSAKSIHSFFLYTTQGDAEQAELQEGIYTNDTQACYIIGMSLHWFLMILHLSQAILKCTKEITPLLTGKL